MERWRTWGYVAWGLCYWAGQPPLHWPIAGWASALIFAVLVIHGPGWTKREGWWAWMVASAVWLALLHGIRLAFWPLTFGWIALSLYLAIYLPISILMARSLARRFRMPMPLACAVGWTACEVLRAYVATGFAGCMLVHSQTPWPGVLPIASHFGGYGVGFMMVLSMAWLVAFERSTRKPAEPTFWDRLWRDSTAVAVLLWLMFSMLGLWRRDAYLQELQPIKPIGRFLLIQGNMPTIFDASQELLQRGWIEYEQTTRRAVASVSDPSSIDVVIWPESIFGGLAPYMQWDRGAKIPEEFDDNRDRFEWMHRNLVGAHEEKMELLRSAFGRAGKLPHFVLGTDVLSVAEGRLDRYNAALWIDDDNPADTDFYAKHHLVMFGEYIPVLSWFPSIMKLIGLGKLSQGESPKAWRLDNGRRIAPSICFENMVPHVIQAHIRELSAAGEEPDVLVNLSNDGWFRGSSALDHHLNSAIVAAVENRTPMLISANTGISAWIDGNGRVVQRLDRLTSGWILAEPLPDGRNGWWSWWGDFPARCIAVLGCMPWALALLAKITPRKTRPRSDQEILRS
ncbi:MAG: apolipoprotein N-acyltransferase [Planctomycetota bacterium]|jgi:apolipoprotein N-acyltransferase